MTDRSFAALDGLALIPRLLHDVHEPSTRTAVLGQSLSAPLLLYGDGPDALSETLALLGAELLLEQAESFPFGRAVALLKPRKMGELMPQVRKLAARRVAAFALELGALAELPPYGAQAVRPKTREDLAELVAAAGAPLWLCGVCSPKDAETAAEAGVAALVVDSAPGRHLGAPSSLELFPELYDAVAGMLSLYLGGPLRSGVDLFRCLAIGAEAVVTRSDRPVAKFQAELAYAMRLTGCATLAEISYEAVFVPLFGDLGPG